MQKLCFFGLFILACSCYFNISRMTLFLQYNAVDSLGRDRLSTSNLMSGRAIRDKLPKCIFEKIEVARVKQGQF